MFMDFRPQQSDEHDLEYAGRILIACGTKFQAMLANGSYSQADLQHVYDKLQEVIKKELRTCA